MISPPEITRPTILPPGYRLLGDIKNPLDNNKHYWFFRYDDLMVIFSDHTWTNKKTGEEKYLHAQVCFPLAALSWVENRFEQFFIPPKAGGQPAGKIANEQEADNETLLFNRGMSVGGPDHGGYILTNLSRPAAGTKAENKLFQKFDFPDPFLLDGGLREFWQKLARRYQQGTL